MELFLYFNFNMYNGKLLVAAPSVIGDTNFHRSVVLVTQHKDFGSLGFILNKKLEYTLNEVLEDIIVETPLYYGGPVEQDNLFFIHNAPSLINDSIKISDHLYWSGDFKAVVDLINTKKLSEKDIRFFLGYSGWSENQLQSEIKLKSWIVLDNHYHGDLLSIKDTNFWKNQMIFLGGKYLIWSNTPENPNLN